PASASRPSSCPISCSARALGREVSARQTLACGCGPGKRPRKQVAMSHEVRSRAGEADGPVLHVVTAARRRGAETFAVDLAEALGARGAPSEVVALAPAAAGGPLPVAVLGPGALAPATLRALRRRARRARAVVAHGSRTLPASALALAGLRTPTVYRSIGDPAAWAGSGRRRLQTRLLLARVDAVTVLWPSAAEDVHRLHGVPRERIHVLPNAVPAARCPVPTAADRAEARRRFGLPAEAPVVAVVGALAPEKRVAAGSVRGPTAAEDAHRLDGVPRERIHVLPTAAPAARCPVPTAADRAEARRRFGLPAEAPVVADVGALAPEKRVGDAIAAVAT